MNILGPFVGHTTSSETCIWLANFEDTSAWVWLRAPGTEWQEKKQLTFCLETLHTAIAKFNQLNPETKYEYKITSDENGLRPTELNGLNQSDLYVYTMPETYNDDNYRYDFLLLSCHNPIDYARKPGRGDGFQVWSALPQILSSAGEDLSTGKTNRVLFGLLGGDQIYSDSQFNRLISAKSREACIQVYLEIYRNYWNNLSYRKVLASLPCYLMWDDHDIIDGWGSDRSSFDQNGEFKSEWNQMFLSARRVFTEFQAKRNPDPLTGKSIEETDSFDCCFKVGPLAFVLADLRSNRNIKKHQFWTVDQFSRVQNWIQSNRTDIEVLFFLSTVVFAHGAPQVEEGIAKHWRIIADFFQHAKEAQRKITSVLVLLWRAVIYAVLLSPIIELGYLLYLKRYDDAWLFFGGLMVAALTIALIVFKIIKSPGKFVKYVFSKAEAENFYQTILGRTFHLISVLIPLGAIAKFNISIGDLTDDIEDGWGGPGNETICESMLNYLFDLQNSEGDDLVHTVILSGDIHTSGFSSIFSKASKHSKRPVIPHIVSSPVGYEPFSWIAEAFYRSKTVGTVPLGKSGTLEAQISHHYSFRNATICSVRKANGVNQLKTKWYLEGFPEPESLIFGLTNTSHREEIKW